MSTSLAHRGPDDEGFMLFTRDGMSCPLSGPATSPGVKDVEHIERSCLEFPAILGWAHRRLSILDLSAAGHQPMQEPGRAALMINGEIYNYRELKEELSALGHIFHSEGDSEVALKAYLEWGTECFSRFRGMWALAIFDETRKELILCRDRFAIKPLYYHRHEGHLSFASEIKALLEIPGQRAVVDERALYQYLAFPAPGDPYATLFAGIRELEPGHFLRLNLMDGAVAVTAYYNLYAAVESVRLPASEDGMLRAYREQLEESLDIHLRADVPVGSCLSGGLDSSAIVSLAAPATKGTFHTFTARYPGHPADEGHWAKMVNRHFSNVQGHDALPEGESLWSEYRRLIRHQDLPIHSTSMYAQWEVMKVAGNAGMKVLLDGQGADEVLGGYDNFAGAYLLQLLLDGKARVFLKESARLRVNRELHTGPALLSAAFHRLPQWIKLAARRKARLGSGFLSTEFRRAYREEVMPDFIGRGSREMAILSLRHGLHDLLRYEDRNAMAFSIESRVPFLDHPLVELGLALPTSLKLRNGFSKYALRYSVQERLPKEVTWRTDKKGFITPQSQWQEGTRDQLVEFLTGHNWPHQLNREAVMAAALSNLPQGTPSNELWKMVSLLVWKEEFNVRF